MKAKPGDLLIIDEDNAQGCRSFYEVLKIKGEKITISQIYPAILAHGRTKHAVITSDYIELPWSRLIPRRERKKYIEMAQMLELSGV